MKYMDKANSFDKMIVLLTNKIADYTATSKKIQPTNLAPIDWSIKKVPGILYVPKYVARTARRLASEKGILATPNPKLGKTHPDVTVQLVMPFSKMMNIAA